MDPVVMVGIPRELKKSNSRISLIIKATKMTMIIGAWPYYILFSKSF
jgi:hypothetical protein